MGYNKGGFNKGLTHFSRERLFLPEFGIEAHKGVSWLNLDPPHLFRHVGPAFVAQKLGRALLRLIIRHVVENVEENALWEPLDYTLRQIFGLAHVVARRYAEILLVAVRVSHATLLQLTRREADVHEARRVRFVFCEGSFGGKNYLRSGEGAF